MKKIVLILFVFVISGCATNKGVTELRQHNIENSAQVVILKDGPTRESVLPVLTKWFSDNGYSAIVIDSLQEVGPNHDVLSYRAWWSWDIATYMRRAEMQVNKDSETLGKIKFDALQYGAFGKFGSAEERIKILLDALFGKITRDEANRLLGEV